MSELGRRARDLLKELKSYGPQTLSPYNEELIRLIFSEVDEHNAQTEAIVGEMRRRQQEGEEAQTDAYEATATTMCLHYECVKRNKRLLLIYMNERMQRLRHMRWTQRALPDAQKARCCQSEIQFYNDYSRVLSTYMSRLEGVGMDLTLDTKPPKDTFVNVRCLKAAGEVILSYGRATILPGTTISLPAEEAEPLIRDGTVELVEWDDGYGRNKQ
ncbi:putative DNA replication complex GINS protein PSF1 [Tetrabaena socialis]|uniref:Putative DNA replication complex GINS protein PSF1 n=1 Tax=Tetrabaena socialis TaxID=47790 RepID=A0A2J8AID4_9CHLO|nr:putative DNA replication complex GINS protein PSF1 [Tetrabaena socialis]|eukprot:PNH12272.1 putative DNA replication complex GINS protein PSF1 [Tetrabaena socialis]